MEKETSTVPVEFPPPKNINMFLQVFHMDLCQNGGSMMMICTPLHYGSPSAFGGIFQG